MNSAVIFRVFNLQMLETARAITQKKPEVYYSKYVIKDREKMGMSNNQ